MANFATPKTSTVKVKTGLTNDGYIAKFGDAGNSSKVLSLPGLKVDCTADEAYKVFDAIYGTIGEADYDKLSITKTITAGVE